MSNLKRCQFFQYLFRLVQRNKVDNLHRLALIAVGNTVLVLRHAAVNVVVVVVVCSGGCVTFFKGDNDIIGLILTGRYSRVVVDVVDIFLVVCYETDNFVFCSICKLVFFVLKINANEKPQLIQWGQPICVVRGKICRKRQIRYQGNPTLGRKGILSFYFDANR